MNKRGKTLGLTLVLAASLVGGAGTATASHSYQDLCAGTVEYDGCTYCSYQRSSFGSNPTDCHYGYFGYTWERCNLWVENYCPVGTLPTEG